MITLAIEEKLNEKRHQLKIANMTIAIAKICTS